MKNFYLVLIALLVVIEVNAQKKGVSIDWSTGYAIPFGNYAANAIASDSIGEGDRKDYTLSLTKTRKKTLAFNLDVAYSLGKLGMGLSIGRFHHKTDDVAYELDFAHNFTGGGVRGTYYGIGPEYGFSLGKLSVTGTSRLGLMSLNVDDMAIFYKSAKQQKNIELFSSHLAKEAGSSVWYSSLGIKLSYPVFRNVFLFVKSDYLTALGLGVGVQETYFPPIDVNRDGEIKDDDVGKFTRDLYRQDKLSFIRPEMWHFNVGVKYFFPLQPRVKNSYSTRSNKTSKTSRVGNPNGQDEGNPPLPTQANDWNSTRSNKTSKTSRVGNPNGQDEGNPPLPTQAQDWNSTRSNKTSKTTRVGNPNGQDEGGKTPGSNNNGN